MNCSCRIVYRRAVEPVIQYCPLHAAAPELFDSLRHAVDALGDSDWSGLHVAERILKAAGSHPSPRRMDKKAKPDAPH